MKRMLLLNMLPLVSLLAVLLTKDLKVLRALPRDRQSATAHGRPPPFRELSNSFDLDQFSRQLERGLISVHPDMPEFKFSIDDAHAVNVYLRSIQK